MATAPADDDPVPPGVTTPDGGQVRVGTDQAAAPGWMAGRRRALEHRRGGGDPWTDSRLVSENAFAVSRAPSALNGTGSGPGLVGLFACDFSGFYLVAAYRARKLSAVRKPASRVRIPSASTPQVVLPRGLKRDYRPPLLNASRDGGRSEPAVAGPAPRARAPHRRARGIALRRSRSPDRGRRVKHHTRLQ
jgi:hypothetical protein